MGTEGPGSIHLLNGLYDAKKSHAQMLAVCGQVPTPDIGTEFFQEVNNDVLFSDVAVFTHTVMSTGQMPQLLEQAVNTAYSRQGVAVLTVPGDIGELEMDNGRVPRFARRPAQGAAPTAQVQEVARVLSDAGDVTLLVGRGALDAREQVWALADRLKAPIVLTLKAKEGSMANAMPQALGAQALDRRRQIIACCGDGGLMMLLGDLRTAVTYDLPATFVVFDNGRLGTVKLEQEQGGLPEFGTELDNPDIAAVAIAIGLEAVRVTDPDEVSIPPKAKVSQAWGFAIARSKETLESA